MIDEAGQATRVIAIGSPHGDDQLAWRVAARLRARCDLPVVSLADPLKLHDHLDACDRLIIVDACAGGGAPGTVTRLQWPDRRIQVRHSHSSHGFGVAGALQLAEKLDILPPTIVLFGVELALCAPGEALSSAVQDALGELERQVLGELHRMESW